MSDDDPVGAFHAALVITATATAIHPDDSVAPETVTEEP